MTTSEILSKLAPPGRHEDKTREWPELQDLYPAKHRPRPHPTVGRAVGEATVVGRVSQPLDLNSAGFTRLINPADLRVTAQAPVPARPTPPPSGWRALLERLRSWLRGAR